MTEQRNVPRRRLVVDARAGSLDALAREISALLAAAGFAVRRLVEDVDGRGDPPVGETEVDIDLRAVGPDDPAPAGAAPPVLTTGDLVVMPEARAASRAGEDLELTRIEFDLLYELLRHANRVLTKETLLRRVWRHEPVTANAIEARVSRLRAKLERRGPRVIHTVRGVGYVLHALPDRSPGAGVVIELVAAEPAVDPTADLTSQASPA
jgi:DNA-binding response OmpR family regulator